MDSVTEGKWQWGDGREHKGGRGSEHDTPAAYPFAKKQPGDEKLHGPAGRGYGSLGAGGGDADEDSARCPEEVLCLCVGRMWGQAWAVRPGSIMLSPCTSVHAGLLASVCTSARAHVCVPLCRCVGLCS